MELGEPDTSLRPVEEVVPVARGERDHVCRVGRDEVLMLLERQRVRRLEERPGRCRVAARSADASALEVDTRGDDPRVATEGSGLVQQGVSRLEVAAQAADARELREDLGAPASDASASSCACKRFSVASRSSKSHSGRRRSSMRQTLELRSSGGDRRDAGHHRHRARRLTRCARARGRASVRNAALRVDVAAGGAPRGRRRR